MASSADRDLARRLVAGDEDALAEAYDLYSSLVFGLAHRVTGSRSSAEDIAQDVFVRLWTAPEGFDPERGSLRTYLGMLTHGRAVDVVRSDARRRAREEAEGGDAIRLEPAAWERPESVEDDDLAVRVRRAVGRLPPPQREALRLAYFGGHSYRSVATLLGIPEGTAKSRLRQALAKLGDLLAAEGAVEWQ
ncbi:MAG TPA: sigma-70 family RNA polymerase sigma factor [Acidimicrobiales bacterium]|nr:sigma-70 family RNA polymerase sigma factor [Acidimicrobiales bacterium]